MDLTEAENIKRRWQEYTEELWREVQCHCSGDRDQDHPREKEMQKSKMVV